MNKVQQWIEQEFAASEAALQRKRAEADFKHAQADMNRRKHDAKRAVEEAREELLYIQATDPLPTKGLIVRSWMTGCLAASAVVPILLLIPAFLSFRPDYRGAIFFVSPVLVAICAYGTYKIGKTQASKDKASMIASAEAKLMRLEDDLARLETENFRK
jgi:hypothetical protein